MNRLARRWWKFNAVGAMGIVVQVGVLAVLKEWAGLGYLAATALAVEAAILHNFCWHERWTWRPQARQGWPRRLLKFQLTTGVVSLVANLVLMRVLVGWLGVPYVVANLAAITAAWLGNFAAAEWFVFRRDGETFGRRCV